MNKFVKISICMIFTLGVFIGVNKLMFKENTYPDYFTKEHVERVTIEFIEQQKLSSSTLVKFKVTNNSKFYFDMWNNYLFLNQDVKTDGNSSAVIPIKISPYIDFKDEDELYGKVKPKSTKEISYLIPSSIDLESDELNLGNNNVGIEYEGQFQARILFSKSTYFTVSSYSSMDYFDINQ